MVDVLYKRSKPIDDEAVLPRQPLIGKKVPQMSFFRTVRDAISGKLDLTPAFNTKANKNYYKIDWENIVANTVPKEEVNRDLQEAVKVMVVAAHKLRAKR